MKIKRKITLCTLLCSLVLSLLSAAGLVTAKAEVETEYVASETAPVTYVVEDYVPLNAEGISLFAGAGKSLQKSWTVTGLWQDNCVFKVGLSVSENKSNMKALRFFWGGTSPWDTYGLILNYPDKTLSMESSGSTTKGTQQIATNVPLEYDATYQFEIKYTKLLGSTSGSYIGDTFDLHLYGDGVDVTYTSTFLNDERCARVKNDGKPYPAFGMYTDNQITFTLKAYDFQREYYVLVADGEKRVPYVLSYGEEYDFSDYIPDKAGYTKKGFKATVGNSVLIAPVSGIWTTDITEQTNGKYSATFEPYYELIEYPVTYSFDTTKASLSGGTPQSVNVENEGTVIPALENLVSGYVFIGWYLDSAYTIPATVYEYKTGVTLYGKIVAGYTLTLYLPDGTTKIAAVEKGKSYTFPEIALTGYEPVSGWEQKTGDSWTAVQTIVTPTANSEYRAVASKKSYTVTYELDGGENPAENVSSFTVEDEIELKAPQKEGYFFVGFQNAQGEWVTRIERGTSENITLTAKFVKDNFRAEERFVQSDTAVSVPLYTVPETAETMVSVFKGEVPVGLTDGKAVFSEVGDYTVSYLIKLITGGEIVKTVVVHVVSPTITVEGEYEKSYEAGTRIALLDATCDAPAQTVEIKVFKDGEEISYSNFSIEAKAGEYKVQYFLASGMAQTVEKTFTVTASKNGCSSGVFGAGTAIQVIITMAAVAFVTIIKNKNKEK